MNEVILAIALWCGAGHTKQEIECRLKTLNCLVNLSGFEQKTKKEEACWVDGLEPNPPDGGKK